MNIKFTNCVRIKGNGPHGPREQQAHNTLTYAAADIMIAALLQSGPSKVTWLYAQHGGSSSSTSAPPLPLPTDLRTANQADFVATENTYNSGGLWVPLLAAPAVESTSLGTYNGNMATYYFRIPGTLPSNQYTGNFVPGSSYIYSLALAVTQNSSDRSQDRIISALGNGVFTPFIISANGQEAVDYPMQITIQPS